MELGLTVGDSIDRIEQTARGFDFVEFGLAESKSIPADIDHRALRERCERTDVAFDVHLPFKQDVATGVDEINQGIVEYQRRLLEWAGELGARKAVLHATVRNPSDTSLRPIFAEQLESIVEVGNEAGVEVVVENVGHQPRGLPLSVLGDIATEVDAPVCFDVGHAYMEDGQDGIERFLSGYRDQISHVHMHDARSRGDTHLPLGAGEIEYTPVRTHLEDFSGTVAIEVFCDDRDLLIDTAERTATIFDADWNLG